MADNINVPADMTFNLQVPAPAVQLILAGLGQLPHSQVAPVFDAITAQIREQATARQGPQIVRASPGDLPQAN